MKRSLWITLAFAATVATSLAFTKDEPKYKNLKILPKNITKPQLDSVMHHFSLSLGVKCTYCHMHDEATNVWDFASDENKHKLAARSMMKMMDKINNKYFDVTGGKKDLNARLMVTCFTCHRGSNEPATMPPHMERPQQRPPADSTRQNQ
jgi:hypothetical protein